MSLPEVDRRTFLKQVAVASAATAVPIVADPDPAGSQPVTDTPLPTWHRAPCRLCGVGCGLLIGVDAGRAVGVKGDPDSTVAKGLACVKGYHAVQALAGPDRITQALVRQSGSLAPVPLAHALDLVAERLREAIDRRGVDAVGMYGSAQWTAIDSYVAAKFFRGGLGCRQIDTSARLHAGSAITGLETSYGLDGAVGGYEDFDAADLFVLWDINLAESDPVLFSRMLTRRRRDPAVRIIDLTTRTTRTSYAADQSVLLQPHTVLPIANAMCQELMARKLVNRDFVERYVSFRKGTDDAATGGSGGGDGGSLLVDGGTAASLPEFEAFLEAYHPERAQELSGVPAATIRWLAAQYGDPTRRVVSVWGTNVDADIRGTWTNNALHNIHLLVGKVGTPGNHPLPLAGQPNLEDAGALAHHLPRGVVTSEADRRRAAEIWKVPVERIAPTPGHPVIGMFDALVHGDIGFLWIQATNPMLSLPNLERYRTAARGDGPFVVVTEAYPTPTTDVADVVLPAAVWIEREGVYANGDRRLQYMEALVSPPGDAAPDSWHMIEVARRLGLGDLFPPAWTRTEHGAEAWTEYLRFHTEPTTTHPGLDVLADRAGARWPWVAGGETVRRYRTAADPAADRTRGEYDFYGHADHRARIWLRPFVAPVEIPDATHPYWLTTGPVLEHWGGGALTQRIPTLHRGLPHGYVEIHKDDAAALGVQNRDRVRLTNRRGSVETEARIDYRSQPPRGMLFAPWFDEGTPVHRLMGSAVDPWSGQPDGRKCAVRIERIGPGRVS